MKRLFLSIIVLFSVTAFSQNTWTLRGRIHGLPLAKLQLANYYGERTLKTDSTVTDSTGRFLFTMKGSAKVGLYRVAWGKDKSFDLVWNRENVDIITDASAPSDSMKIAASEENLLYYHFMRYDRMNQSKLEVLMPVVDYYPEKDLYYNETIFHFEQIQKEEAQVLDSLALKYPGSYAVRIFKIQRTPFLAASLPKSDRMDYLKQHFFDKTDFNDTLLLNSTAWANKAIAYLSLYSNNKLNQKQLEAEFIKAVTSMLSAASGNAEVYKYLLDYFVSGFDKYHFDGVVTYISDNFQDPFSCEDPAKKSSLQKKLENFKKLAIGKTAPDLEVPDAKGKKIKLSEVPGDYVLVVFWSSECPHCAEMMPKLKKLYESQKPRKYEVFAVSLDTSRTEWTSFLKTEKLSWLNGCDLKGFDGPAANDYNIYATPTMFLLDRSKKILAKPISYRELEQDLREQKLITN
jgi:peroxiredoxin